MYSEKYNLIFVDTLCIKIDNAAFEWNADPIHLYFHDVLYIKPNVTRLCGECANRFLSINGSHVICLL